MEKITKTRCFNITTPPERFEQVKNRITQIKGVESVGIKQNKLIVRYDLMQYQYALFKPLISGLVQLKSESAMNKLRTSLICFIEKNEFNHAQSPCGWGYYVQNLYLSLNKENQF